MLFFIILKNREWFENQIFEREKCRYFVEKLGNDAIIRKTLKERTILMKHIFVNQMTPGHRVIGFYVVSALQPHIVLPDKCLYWRLQLSDRTGDIYAYVRECPAVEISRDDVGRLVFVDATVTAKKNDLFLMCSHESIELIDFNDISLDEMMNFFALAPRDPQKMMAEVEAIIASIDDENYRTLCYGIVEKNRQDFIACPATETEHHPFVCGLLMHTRYMLHIADYLAALYGDEVIDRNLLLAGTLVHDMGKLREYSFNSVGNGLWNDEGVLETHETLGAKEIEDAAEAYHIDAEKTELLKNMVLAHHYSKNDKASTQPASVEAAILCLVNNIDSLIEGYREILEAKYQMPATTYCKKSQNTE